MSLDVDEAVDELWLEIRPRPPLPPPRYWRWPVDALWKRLNLEPWGARLQRREKGPYRTDGRLRRVGHTTRTIVHAISWFGGFQDEGYQNTIILSANRDASKEVAERLRRFFERLQLKPRTRADQFEIDGRRILLKTVHQNLRGYDAQIFVDHYVFENATPDIRNEKFQPVTQETAMLEGCRFVL